MWDGRVTTRVEILVRHKRLVSEMGITLTDNAEGVDIVCSTWRHVAVRKDGGRLTTSPEHQESPEPACRR